jgi:hypothetical protein
MVAMRTSKAHLLSDQLLPLLAATCYTPQPEPRGRCCAVSGYSPGAIFSDAYNRSRPEADIRRRNADSFFLGLQTLPDCGDDPFAATVGKTAGFSLHAGVAAKANERGKLERLCRYIARPAVATKRLSLTRNGVHYTVLINNLSNKRSALGEGHVRTLSEDLICGFHGFVMFGLRWPEYH